MTNIASTNLLTCKQEPAALNLYSILRHFLYLEFKCCIMDGQRQVREDERGESTNVIWRCLVPLVVRPQQSIFI